MTNNLFFSPYQRQGLPLPEVTEVEEIVGTWLEFVDDSGSGGLRKPEAEREGGGGSSDAHCAAPQQTVLLPQPKGAPLSPYTQHRIADWQDAAVGWRGVR